MTKEEFAQLILNEIDEMIFVIDIDTYELLYLNSKGIELLCDKNESWENRACYEVMCGFDKPCEWCPNSIIREKGRYSWEIFNEKINKYLYEKYKMITINGRQAKLCVASDITKQKLAAIELTKRLELEETLVKCVRTLNENDDADEAINVLLSIIAEYHDADRAYIFEYDENEDNIMDNTYEWCAEGVKPQIGILQRLDVALIDRWIEYFEKDNELCISSLTGEVDKDSEEYKILQIQEVESLMTAPLRIDGKISGFIGVDNPKKNLDTRVLLRSVNAFVMNDIQKRKAMAKLFELSYGDRLTKVGNRHSYVERMIEFETKYSHSLGIIFADINGLKIANDVYGHEYGDKMIRDVANILKKIFVKDVYRIGGDEFVVFCPDIDEAAFEEKVAQLNNNWPENITVSVGSVWENDCKNVKKHVMNADKLMYENKKRYYAEKKD
ncbi:MAG: sensor domain-containing diguanylate cyclase [Lachnospiraceae bacterium]|nr:sensor domain-containing diguanylate cyclase [Lachnospiraceae bacterium]